MKQQQRTLEELMDEKCKLLAIQNELQRLHETLPQAVSVFVSSLYVWGGASLGTDPQFCSFTPLTPHISSTEPPTKCLRFSVAFCLILSQSPILSPHLFPFDVQACVCCMLALEFHLYQESVASVVSPERIRHCLPGSVPVPALCSCL